MAIPGLLKRNSSPDTQKVTVKDFALNTEHIFQQFWFLIWLSAI